MFSLARAIIMLLKSSKIAYMKWTDSQRIAEELFDKYPNIDPKTILFTDLMKWVMALDGFTEGPEHCGEKILEAIQLEWLSEYQ